MLSLYNEYGQWAHGENPLREHRRAAKETNRAAERRVRDGSSTRTDRRRPLSLVETKPSSLLDAGEQALVDAIRAGDFRAAAPLYRSLRPSVEKALKRVLRTQSTDFEDLVQISFERFMRSIAKGNFRGQSQLKTWVFSIAKHVAADWLRRRSAEQKVLEVADVNALEQQFCHRTTEAELEARSEVRRVQGVLRRMKRVSATALMLHDVYEHSMKEVARELDMSVTAAESRVRRARMEFARRMATNVAPRDARLDCD